MNASHCRGACPALSAPMPTGDGLLVRLTPTTPVPCDAFVGFCEAARRHGNGTIEISARGSLQVRGLAARSVPLFASAVAELGISASAGVSVVASPLFDAVDAVMDTAAVAADLRRALERKRFVLSPKVSVVVDGGGDFVHLDCLAADIRLRAVGPARQPQFCVALGGDGESATWLGSVAPRDVVGAVLGLLTVIAARGPAARAVGILRTEGIEAFHSVPFIVLWSAPLRREPAQMIGLHALRGGKIALGIGLAFGHSQADVLAELIRVAAAFGARAVRPAHDRCMLLIGVAASRAADLMAAAEQLGFIARTDDPRRRIAACPGTPACASGLISARALASALTPTLEPLLERGRNEIAVHISGCLKGCAYPMPAALTLVGTPGGCGVVHHGSARATPDEYVDPANIGAKISQIAESAGEAAHG